MILGNEGWEQRGGCEMQARHQQDKGHSRPARDQVGCT